MATLAGAGRRLRAAIDVMAHGTLGLTGELERRTAALDAEVAQLRGQVTALQAVTAGLDAIRLEVAGLSGPSGRLVVNGGPWWSLLPFSAHRIELWPGAFTADSGVEARDDLRTRVMLDESGGFDGLRVLDVGCLEGAFAVECARLGAAEVVGVEARAVSVRRCDLVRDLLGLDNLRFVRADLVHELAREQEPYDVVLATGILYHLANPDVVLRLIRERCRGFLLLCTHVARPDAPTHGCSKTVVEHHGESGPYLGRSYSEEGVGPQAATDGDDLWASWSDAVSFWPFEEELQRMIVAAGFSSMEKVEPGDFAEPWQVDQTNRVMYICRV